MIGRADIEGSKSNVAMNACTATQGSYACGWGAGGGSSWTEKVGTMMHLTKPRVVIHMSPWSKKGSLRRIMLHEDVKYYMSYIAKITLQAQITWIFHYRHVKGLEHR